VLATVLLALQASIQNSALASVLNAQQAIPLPLDLAIALNALQVSTRNKAQALASNVKLEAIQLKDLVPVLSVHQASTQKRVIIIVRTALKVHIQAGELLAARNVLLARILIIKDLVRAVRKGIIQDQAGTLVLNVLQEHFQKKLEVRAVRNALLGLCQRLALILA